jgi:hypothetical protein
MRVRFDRKFIIPSISGSSPGISGLDDTVASTAAPARPRQAHRDLVIGSLPRLPSTEYSHAVESLATTRTCDVDGTRSSQCAMPSRAMSGSGIDCYGPGWAGPLLAAYGVEPDERRSAYYRLLWDVAL